MKIDSRPPRLTKHIAIIATSIVLGAAASAAIACGNYGSKPFLNSWGLNPQTNPEFFHVMDLNGNRVPTPKPAPKPEAARKAPEPKAAAKPKPVETADWHKNEECRKVFFTVLEGLYRDGISQEIVDLVIGRVESNDLEKAFIFRCKLCHACYEAFAVYQRRPQFHGTEGMDTIGKREIPKEIIETLRTGGRIQFDNAFAFIVQPWIKGKLEQMIESGEAESAELMAKYVELAKEGNSLIVGYARCQACDAIAAVAEKIDEEKKK